MSKINDLLGRMWADYIILNPHAQKIVNLLESEGEAVLNDHIALRTFNDPRVSIDIIAKPFLESGYVEAGDYHFEAKKLYAKHFQHEDPKLPKVFISELLLEKFSDEFNQIVQLKLNYLSDEQIGDFTFTTSGKSWDISQVEYNKLKNESDYGAWLSAIGYRPNHFTVSLNDLKKYSDILTLNAFLKKNDYKLNDSGGEVKGSVDVFLEQSSTLAASVEVQFTDGALSIPSCYFEFAKRYIDESGKLYQGFVAKSADKIFESTDKSQ